MRLSNPLPFSLLEQAFADEVKAATSTARRVFAHVPGETTIEVVSTCECRDVVGAQLCSRRPHGAPICSSWARMASVAPRSWLIGSVARGVKDYA